ncbi:MAG TPA: NrpR regulatory domain-containing protein [Chloroflexota bacterium]|nr:NrpR regulatory domain-containing protein [Chloroflexota bacterium]
MMTSGGIDSKTRLEILRLVAELDNPVGADTLTGRLAERGIGITVDAVRYHLRLLDEQGFTSRVGNQGRTLTDEGWRELRRSLVDTRMRHALARTETLAQQVSFDPGSRSGQVVASLTIFPADRLSTVLQSAVAACRAGICVSDMSMLVRGGQKLGGVLIPKNRMGLVMSSTATIDGLLLSHGVLFRSTFGGILEVAGWHPYRFVDVVDFGYGSRDPVEVLIRPGSTRVRSTLERGYGLILADVREVVGVARDRVRRILDEIRPCGLGGVLMVGQVGQPILGVPVQQHTFGIAIVAGVNPTVASYEAGVAAEFHCSETMVDYTTLCPIESLVRETNGEALSVGGSLKNADGTTVWSY